MALGPAASFLYKISEGGLTAFMFICMFNSYMYVHGIRYVFMEVKKPEYDVTMVYFAVAEISLCVAAVVLRAICLIGILG